MSKVQVPQVDRAFDALPPVRPLPQGGPTGKTRGFVIPQGAAESAQAKMPNSEEIDAALTAAADSIEENGATPEQAEGMREITRIVMESGNPPAAAGRVLELIEEVKAAEGCTALNGQCARHIDDHGETIHRGLPHRASAAGDNDLLAHSLIQWGDDVPRLEFVGGGTWPDLDLPDVDALIAATERQLASLRDSRAHLATALGEAPPTQPPENQQAQGGSAAQALATLHRLKRFDILDAEFWTQIDTAITTSSDPQATAGEVRAAILQAIEKFSGQELASIAASLGAEIIEVDPANKPASLKNTEVHGWYTDDPTPQLIFPADQPLYRRLTTARKIAATLKAAA